LGKREKREEAGERKREQIGERKSLSYNFIPSKTTFIGVQSILK